jgi:3-oxoacyl-[acyl-carrier-protein] synthase-3
VADIWLAAVAHYVPDRVVSNQEIIDARALKMKSAWLEKNIGIRERRWAAPEQAASDLAVKAVEQLGLGDFRGSLWVSTVSPDYFTPSTSSLVKGKLGWQGDAPAFDVSAACAGHLFALESAAQRLRASDETEAVVVATEVRSRFLNPDDRRTVFLFGDGAAAFLLRKEANAPGKVEWVRSRTRASKEFEILVPGGGSVRPASAAMLADSDQYIRMNDGQRISELTTSTLVQEIRGALAEHGRAVADYDYYVFHQGNASIAGKICEEIGVPAAKTWVNFDRFGNTSSASLGIALSEAHQKGLVPKGGRVLLMAMGAGYHFSIASLRWGLG